MKIAFLISSFRTGGKEKFTADVLRSIDHTQFDPFLCVMKDGGLLETIPNERVYKKLAFFRGDIFGVAWRLWRIFRKEQPQIIVAVGNRLDSWWGRFIGWWMGIPVRILEHHGERNAGQAPFLPPDRWVKRFTTHYIAIGPDLREQLIQREGISPEKITLILNGVDTHTFRPKSLEETHQIKQKVLGIPIDTPLIGCVAGLRHEKNLGLLIHAAAEIPKVQVMIIGEGPERLKLETLIRELKLENRVRLMGVRRDVADLLPAFDMVTLTSVTEATPLSLMEAMACGVPMVATAVGSIPDMVQNGKTGYVIPPGNVQQLVEKLNFLLENPDLRQNMGQAAREHAVEHFSIKASVAAREKLFLQLLENSLPRP